MRRIAVLLAALLLAAGCGGDDEQTTSGEAAATGTELGVEEGAPYDVTVGEFIAELQPDKQRILEAFVADSSACKGVEVDSSFVLLVSAQAIETEKDAPLTELVEEQCR